MLKREEIFWFYSTAMVIQGMEKKSPLQILFIKKYNEV